MAHHEIVTTRVELRAQNFHVALASLPKPPQRISDEDMLYDALARYRMAGMMRLRVR